MANLDTAAKIKLFESLFTGLGHVYGTYDKNTGQVRQVKEPVTERVIYDHLRGRVPYGVYLLKGDKVNAIAADFDEDRLDGPQQFVAASKKYNLCAYIERSKSKGFHVWIFFAEPVLAAKARQVVKKILCEIGKPDTEVFPKQDKLDGPLSYGNFINAPLFGALVPKVRTVFVDPSDPTRVYPDQWKLLESIEKVSQAQLDTIIESYNLTIAPQYCHTPSNDNQVSNGKSPFGLPPCARKILTDGVDAYQRVSCFRLAVQLKRNGLPFDLTVTVLHAWSLKNRPAEGKQIISDHEIEKQVRCAFENTYRSFGCEEPAIARFCDTTCPLYVHRVNKTVQTNSTQQENHNEDSKK